MGLREQDDLSAARRFRIWRQRFGLRPLTVLRSATHGSLSLWDLVHEWPFTAVSIVLVFVACTRPQILNVVFDLPWPYQVKDGLLPTLGLGLVVVFLALSAALGAVLVIPMKNLPSTSVPSPDPPTGPAATPSKEQPAPIPRLWRAIANLHRWIQTGAAADGSAPSQGKNWWLLPVRAAGRFARSLADAYPMLDAHLRKRGRWTLRAAGMIFLGGALVWLFLPMAWAERTPAASVMSRQILLSLAFAGSALWFLISPKAPSSFSRRMWGRCAFMVTFGLIGGELSWQLPAWTHGELSFRFYTIWGVTFLLFLMVAFGRIVDRLPAAWRLATVVVVLVVSQWDAGFVVDTHPITDPTATSEETREWFGRLRQRIQTGRAGEPVVLVAASGGGSRAAMFAGLVLEYLEHIGFDGKPAGTAEDAIANNVAAISSVSGGSLATAYYLQKSAVQKTGLQQLTRAPSPAYDGPHNFIANEVAASMARIADRYSAVAAKCHGQSTDCAYLDEDEPIRQRRLGAFDRVAREVRTLPVRGPEIAPWLFSSRFVDDMATDFMAPLLRGVLTPFIERGHSVSNFWADRFGWHGFSQHGCWDADSSDPPRRICDWDVKRPPPLALLNATDVTTGRRVVVDFPPVPTGLLGSHITSLNDHGGPYDLALADAVRLSANFPWGFEVGLFEPKHTLLVGSQKTSGPRIKLTDGGVTDNSGLDTFATLIEQVEILSRLPTADAVPGPGTPRAMLADGARTIRDLLLERGLMLVEIDSGARPSAVGLLGRIFPSVIDPLDALSLAGYGGALTMKTGHIARIRAAMERMADQDGHDSGRTVDRGRLFYHLPFICNHVDDVMTAWALGPEDKAKLMTLFLVEAESNRMALGEYQASTARLRSEAEAARRLSTPASQRLAEQLLAELRHAERERQHDETENVLADQNLVIQAEDPSAPPPPARIGSNKNDTSPPPLETPPPASTGAAAGAAASTSPTSAPASPRIVAQKAKAIRFDARTPSAPATSGEGLGTEASNPPPGATPTAGGGQAWVYLGHYDSKQGKWLTTYFKVARSGGVIWEPDALSPGTTLEAIGRTNVRPAKPDTNANLAGVKAVLRSNAQVVLADYPISWQQTGLIWAQVRF